jgi:CRISPR-associated protein Cas5/CasD subtype I-E
MLGCALGVNTDKELGKLSQSLRMGVRCDRPGTRLIDYHTVGGGYNYPALLTAEGKPKISSGEPHTEQTWRHYLCDASFLVALQGDLELIQRLARGVQGPRWTIYLGRKSCPPSRPVFDGMGDFPNLETALSAWPWRHSELSGYGPSEQKARVRVVLECEPAQGVRRRDEIASHTRRTFDPRYTREIELTLDVAEEDSPCTSPA